MQPVGLKGEVKLINRLTMEGIATTVLQEGLATAQVDDLVRALYKFAADPDTLAGTPCVVQAWGRRPTPEAPSPS